MKESELKDYERVALRVYRDSKFIADSPHSALYQFGKEIAEKLEPELKPVDMNVLIGSGIDCVFADDLNDLDDEKSFSSLVEISPHSGCYFIPERIGFDYCKPRMNYWFSFMNFKNTIDLVNKLDNAGFDFKISSETGAFMIKGLKDGFCWPWEAE